MTKPTGKLAYAYATIAKMEARIAELEALAAPAEDVRAVDEPVAWVTMHPDWKDSNRTVLTSSEDAEEYHRTCYDLTPLYRHPQRQPQCSEVPPLCSEVSP